MDTLYNLILLLGVAFLVSVARGRTTLSRLVGALVFIVLLISIFVYWSLR